MTLPLEPLQSRIELRSSIEFNPIREWMDADELSINAISGQDAGEHADKNKASRCDNKKKITADSNEIEPAK